MTSAAVSRRERRSLLASLPKPKARGWIHAITAPLALANAIVVIALAPTTGMKLACLVFGVSSVVLFGHSAVYHLGKWSPKIELLLKRMDHSNIFLLIAGTYTPLTVAMLAPRTAAYVLAIVWAPFSNPTPRDGCRRRSTSCSAGSPYGSSPSIGRRAAPPWSG